MKSLTSPPPAYTFVAFLTRFLLPVGLLVAMFVGWVLPKFVLWQQLRQMTASMPSGVTLPHGVQPVACAPALCWQGEKAVLLQFWQSGLPGGPFEEVRLTSLAGQTSLWHLAASGQNDAGQ